MNLPDKPPSTANPVNLSQTEITMTDSIKKIVRVINPINGYQYIMSQSVRELLSPMVFYDSDIINFEEDIKTPMHPHSGIGIITYIEGGELHHKDSSGNNLTVNSGGMMWMRTGGGLYHDETYVSDRTAYPEKNAQRMYQLWLQLPPEYEESEAEYGFFENKEIPLINGVKILAGEYKGVKSPLKTPFNLSYFSIDLKAGETFSFTPPSDQDTGFLLPYFGNLSLGNEPPRN